MADGIAQLPAWPLTETASRASGTLMQDRLEFFFFGILTDDVPAASRRRPLIGLEEILPCPTDFLRSFCFSE